jgi:Tol biopolymer transport system component
MTIKTPLGEDVGALSAIHRVHRSPLVENVDVWRVPLDPVSGIADGALERITDNASADRVGNVSVDGRTMVFVSSRAQRDEVWLKDLRTGVERQLTSAGAVDARISPDGTMVAASSLMHEPRLRAAVGTTAMNDVQGGYLYMSLTETTGNIWLMK